jgi:hypothetical protein
LTGKTWTIEVETLSPSAEAPANGGSGAGGEVSPPRSKRSPKEEAEKVPLVKRALDVLGATVHKADEGFGTPPESKGRAGEEP